MTNYLSRREEDAQFVADLQAQNASWIWTTITGVCIFVVFFAFVAIALSTAGWTKSGWLVLLPI